MKRLLLPSALAFTFVACGSPSKSDAGYDAGQDGGANDGGNDDGGNPDGGCDCMGMCPPEACFPFSDGDGGTLCECAI